MIGGSGCKSENKYMNQELAAIESIIMLIWLQIYKKQLILLECECNNALVT